MSCPPMSGHGGLGRDVRDQAAIEHDTANQQTSAMQRQPGVSVTYTDLRVLERASFGSTWVM